MQYSKIYDSIVSSRKNRILKSDEYYERHHIIPKCLGGIDGKDNIVILTAREHYVCHWLLTKIYKDNSKLWYAFFQMAKCNKRNGRIISSLMYERAKRGMKIATRLRKLEPDYVNGGKSEKSRAVAKARMSSSENPMKKFPEKNPFIGKSFVKGRKFYNNGIENIYIYETDVIPAGFIKGMAPYKRNRQGTESNH